MSAKRVFVVLLVGLAILITACSKPVSASLPQQEEPSQDVLAADGDIHASTQSLTLTGNEESTSTTGGYPYTIVDTGQDYCYSDTSSIPCPSEGEAFYGQDAQYEGVQASYVDNGDGTVTDLNTGLMWQQTPDLDNKVTFDEALAGAETFNLAGYTDWRLPTIKELYSLIDFTGGVSQGIPYIDTDYFDFRFGDESLGEREIDAQYWSSTEYVGTTMNGLHTVFGVNFADGRIKGYGTSHPNAEDMSEFVRYVRGSADYGVNDFIDNDDGSITDQATGLMWQGSDSGETLNWEGALNYCEGLDYAGYDDWRLPNAKELQRIVDYTRSPQTSNSAAIDPLFDVTEVESWYWTSTTHLDTSVENAVYIAFGQAFGLPNGNLIDVHGAGAQRSDPKSGDPADYPEGRGTEGQDDQIRIYNYARCVRGGASDEVFTGGSVDPTAYKSGRAQQEGQGLASSPGQESGDSSGTPPQEAIDACTGLAANAACTFDAPKGAITGICMLAPSGNLACIPANGRPPQSGQ